MRRECKAQSLEGAVNTVLFRRKLGNVKLIRNFKNLPGNCTSITTNVFLDKL